MDIGMQSARTTGRPVSSDTFAILNMAAQLLTCRGVHSMSNIASSFHAVQGNSASSDSICQHTQRHSKTLGHTRSPRLIGPGLQPSHASAKSTSRKHTVLESSRDHTESCSASPPKAECSAAEHQSLKQQVPMLYRLLL